MSLGAFIHFFNNYLMRPVTMLTDRDNKMSKITYICILFYGKTN